MKTATAQRKGGSAATSVIRIASKLGCRNLLTICSLYSCLGVRAESTEFLGYRGKGNMTRMDVQALLQPVSEESPGGEDCEYLPSFIELEKTANGKQAQESAGEVIPAEAPNWPNVAEQAASLLSETKDLRVAVRLIRAATNLDGLAGVADGLELIHGLLEQYWDDLFPPLDKEDDNDPTMRLNSLLPLIDPGGLIKDVVESPMVSARRAGQFSLRDIKLASGDLNPREDEERPDPALIDAAFEEAGTESLQKEADAVAKAQEQISNINDLLNDKVGDQAPSFELLEKQLELISTTLAPHLPTTGKESENGEVAEQSVSGEIRSREDVIRSIDRISAYFRKHEPSSPVPYLLERAKGLISKDYLEIISNLTPGSVKEATNILKGDQNG